MFQLIIQQAFKAWVIHLTIGEHRGNKGNMTTTEHFYCSSIKIRLLILMTAGAEHKRTFRT
jgi:hypothetical protein